MSFCNDHMLTPLPLIEQLILMYIVFKAHTVGFNSFKIYLAAIRALHTCNYLSQPPPNIPYMKLVSKALELQASA